MSDKSVEERLSVLEKDAEHTRSALTRIEGLFTSLHNDIHNTQAQSNSNINAARVELKQDVERHRTETTANFAKLEKMFGDLSKDVKEHHTAINVELARQKTNTRWIIVFGLGLVGAAFADSVGWVSLIGKLFSGG